MGPHLDVPARPVPGVGAFESWPAGVPVGLGALAVLALCANDACASTLGSLATSGSLLAAVAALVMINGASAHWPAGALPTAGGVLICAAGAAWLWRNRAVAPLAAAGVGARRRALLQKVLPDAAARPAGIDREALLAELRRHFVDLQAAWDLGEMGRLRRLTTPDMLDELCSGALARAAGDASNPTEVITLHAELLDFEDLAEAQLASVEFSGLIRESADQGAAPFRELWMLARSKDDGAGWRLARHHALL